MALLYWMFWSSGTWLGFDEPVSGKHMLTVVVLFGEGVLPYGLLKKKKEQMSPLTKVLAMGGIYIGIIISILIVVQLSARYSEPLLDFLGLLSDDAFVLRDCYHTLDVWTKTGQLYPEMPLLSESLF